MRRLSMGENTKDSPTALGFPESERLAVFATAIENPDPKNNDLEQIYPGPREWELTRTEPEVVLSGGAADALHQKPRTKKETETSTMNFSLDPRRITKEAYQVNHAASTGRRALLQKVQCFRAKTKIKEGYSRCWLQRLGLAGNS